MTVVVLFFFSLIAGDQNAINDLMQMRLTGGGGGMMAEKLEVNRQQLAIKFYLVSSVQFFLYQ